MLRRYSVAQARSQLAAIVDQAASGFEVELTRRGRPVAIVVSPEVLQRLRRHSLHFRDAYRAFLAGRDLRAVGVNADFATSTRDHTTGRKVSL